MFNIEDIEFHYDRLLYYAEKPKEKMCEMDKKILKYIENHPSLKAEFESIKYCKNLADKRNMEAKEDNGKEITDLENEAIKEEIKETGGGLYDFLLTYVSVAEKPKEKMCEMDKEILKYIENHPSLKSEFESIKYCKNLADKRNMEAKEDNGKEITDLENEAIKEEIKTRQKKRRKKNDNCNMGKL